MTSLLDRRPIAPSSSPTNGYGGAATPRIRRGLGAVVSALVVFASVAVFTGLYASAGHTTSVLIASRTIEVGQPITAADLGQVSASVSGPASTIPVAAASDLAGKRAAVTIPAGSLLTAGDVTSSPSVGAGDAVVGMALKPGQLPSAGLVAGDQVMIVQTASPGTPVPASDPSASTDSGAAPVGVLVPQATVFDVEPPPVDPSATDSQLVSVAVSSTLAAPVATAAAADQVSLVLLPDPGGSKS